MPSEEPVYASVQEMVAGASLREPLTKTADSLSGSPFERVIIGGESYLVKYVGYQLDWLARALGDRECFVVKLWRHGVLAALPKQIDHTIAAVCDEPALLLRDVGQWLVPPGSTPLPMDQHRRFLAHLADFHTAFWGFTDDIGLLPPGNRYTALTPATGARELDDPVPRALAGGWQALADAAPEAHRHALALAQDPRPLVAALERTPATFIHGDWKAGNLGSHPDGRTILLDWGWPGRAAALVDLAWYLAVNCDRLPESKEDTIAAYRTALEGNAIATGSWWQRQLDLALLGAFVQLGWSKTGDADELEWWVRRVVPVAREL
ncbi:hypothetical protein Rhe02_23080 [Rhizocola hellebori]|uniref:Aminoglycoside phosphotransferase family protein n=1 Tax=Rhizocola hellebori TaxID=1392758 RepID=A0A8J3VFJ3_9ACTN|nr:hypothetical protein [Rhizocola hellebori]GIH04241.1 hypothetical protein Rhe02_23080 [Rhizocola hellebori]